MVNTKEPTQEQPKVRTRKKTRTLSQVSKEEKLQILELYNENTCGVEAIAARFNLKYKTVEHYIQDFYNKMVNTRETRQLVRTASFTKATPGYTPPSYVNQSFLKLLSNPNDPELSEHEMMYCHLLTDTLDNEVAIQQSKLDSGIKRIRGTKESNYKQQLYLRGKYLRSKPNVKEYLNFLREQRNKEISGKITKADIQVELVEGLEAAKGSGNPQLAHRIIDSLAKTIGAYTEKIQVEELNPASAYDKMIEMAKEATETKKNSNDVHEVIPD